MVNVVNNRCACQGCKTQPSYGVDDSNKKPEYCSQHAKTGMVIVIEKRCSHPGCPKKPSVDAEGGSNRKSEFCFQHAKAGTVIVKNNRCATDGCAEQPSHSEKAGFCASHSAEIVLSVALGRRPPDTHGVAAETSGGSDVRGAAEKRKNRSPLPKRPGSTAAGSEPAGPVPCQPWRFRSRERGAQNPTDGAEDSRSRPSSLPQTTRGMFLCPTPASLLSGGEGAAVKTEMLGVSSGGRG